MGMFSSDDGDWTPLNLTEEAQEAFNGVAFNIEQMKKVMEENNMTYWERLYANKPNSVDLDEEPHILDSGNRREFETGAVRDIQEGKGRCDLLPLDVVAEFYQIYSGDRQPEIFKKINEFCITGEVLYLYRVVDLSCFIFDETGSFSTMFLEVAKHFEEGCKKYGENNWQKGIPTHCYIDSAVRHYLKYLRGDTDEPHDKAFCWNILCCIWTCIHKPELNDYAKKEE